MSDMRIVASSDFHGYLPEIPECDLLLIAGDFTPVWNHAAEYQAHWADVELRYWLENVPAKHIVGIAGNHDFIGVNNPEILYDLPWHYLNEEMVEIEGLKIYGTPMSPRFGAWSFMEPDALLSERWTKIPRDIDILLVHGPPFSKLDRVEGYSMTKRGWEVERHVGSASLMNQLAYDNWPNLRAVVFGHIHEAYGCQKEGNVRYYNVSHVNGSYEPVNDVVLVDLS
jgi:Icc-related predicted phosphoesterase